MQHIGPLKLVSEFGVEEVSIPLATFETPLWPSTHRGAKVSCACDGIQATLISECMTRSVLVESDSAQDTLIAADSMLKRKTELQQLTQETSHYASLTDIHVQLVGNLLYIRFAFQTGDAAGHNMTTKAADHMLKWILSEYPKLRYVSISGNLCTDKKTSAVNGLLGRGKNVIAEIVIPEKVCARYLKTTPQKIIDLNIKKNLVGTNLAGGIRSANAHFANILLAFYLATGQDAANIIEGSQGFTFAELRNEQDLYFSVTLPNLIMGSVGNGKNLGFVEENLAELNCNKEAEPGTNARRLALLCAASVLCGELSLLAAQTNQGELMRAHLKLERS